jgi:hypothetical protein
VLEEAATAPPGGAPLPHGAARQLDVLKCESAAARAAAIAAVPAPADVLEQWLDGLEVVRRQSDALAAAAAAAAACSDTAPAAIEKVRRECGAEAARAVAAGLGAAVEATEVAAALRDSGLFAREEEREQDAWLVAARTLDELSGGGSSGGGGALGALVGAVLDATADMVAHSIHVTGQGNAQQAAAAALAAAADKARASGGGGASGAAETLMPAAGAAAVEAATAAMRRWVDEVAPRVRDGSGTAAAGEAEAKAKSATEAIAAIVPALVHGAALEWMWRVLALAFARRERARGGPAWRDLVPAQLLAIVVGARGEHAGLMVRNLDDLGNQGGGGGENGGGSGDGKAGGGAAGPEPQGSSLRLGALVRRFETINAAYNSAAVGTAAAPLAMAQAPPGPAAALLGGALPAAAFEDPAFGPLLPGSRGDLEACRGALARMVGAAVRARLWGRAAHRALAAPAASEDAGIAAAAAASLPAGRMAMEALAAEDSAVAEARAELLARALLAGPRNVAVGWAAGAWAAHAALCARREARGLGGPGSVDDGTAYRANRANVLKDMATLNT